MVFFLSEGSRDVRRLPIFTLLLLGAGVAFSPREFIFPLFLLCGGMLVGISLISTYAPRDFSFLFTLFCWALIARVVLAVLLYVGCLSSNSKEVTIRHGFLVGDGYVFSYNGAWIARERESRHEPSASEVYRISQSGAVGSFDYWNAFIYGLSGVNPLSMFFLSAIAGSVAVIFVYLIGHLLWNQTAGRWAAFLGGFWPSHILWGSQNLKEPFTILFVCLAFWAFLNLLTRFRFHFLFIGYLAIISLILLQPPLGHLLVISLLFSLILSSRKIQALFALLVLFLVLAFPFRQLEIFRPSYALLSKATYGIFGSDPAKEGSSTRSLGVSHIVKRLNDLRKIRTLSAKSAFLREKEFTSLGEMLLFLPLGLLYSFLSPFPWQLGGIYQILGVVESLILYLLFWTGMKGFLLLFKRRGRETVSLTLFLIVMLMALGLFEGNVGTLFRHRAPVWIVLFLFIAVGLSVGKKRKICQESLS